MNELTCTPPAVTRGRLAPGDVLGAVALALTALLMVAIALACPARALADELANDMHVQTDDQQVLADEPAGDLQAQTNGVQATADEPVGEMEAQAKAPEDYTYEIRPLIAPFNDYLYVKTDNPDPESFKLINLNWMSAEDRAKVKGTQWERFGAEISSYAVDTTNFFDVVYENAETHRVKGGYIFQCDGSSSESGPLTLRVRVGGDTYKTTDIEIPCPTMTSVTNYLIDTYTTSSMSFFEKLDAVQKALDQLAIYPQGVVDTSDVGSLRYPGLCTGYAEYGLEIMKIQYAQANGASLAFRAYPFVLDSYGFPQTMENVAQKLEPSCTVEQVSNAHEMRNITFNGETHWYGGAGGGRPGNKIDKSAFEKTFTFDGSSSDMGLKGNLETIKKKLVEYSGKTAGTPEELNAAVSDEALNKALTCGTWVRVRAFTFGDVGYAYYLRNDDEGARRWSASSAWVDGRYVNEYEVTEPGATFEDHPNASVVVRDVTYEDVWGRWHTADLVYDYNHDEGVWEFAAGMESPTPANYPTELTRAEVEAMSVDANTNRPPKTGLIYDCSEKPGTPFTTQYLQGITVQKTARVYVRHDIGLAITYAPANATHKAVRLTSSDESVATIQQGRVFGIAPGKATITVTSLDGGFTQTCEVEVVKPVEDITFPDELPSLEVGGKLDLKNYATVTPADAYDKTLTWESEDPDVATVDANGIVTAVTPGLATIWATGKPEGVHTRVWVRVNEPQSSNAPGDQQGSGYADGPQVDTKGAWNRLYGNNAFGTMCAIAEEGFESCDAVVIATVEGYWDALSASALAGKLGSPVLLTDARILSQPAAIEIDRLGAKTAYIVGGTSSVSEHVADVLKMDGLSVKRIAGDNAMQTAEKIAAELGAGRSKTCVVAASSGYWDALAAGPYAYAKRAPIFLAAPDGTLTASTLSAIEAGGYERAVIAGGTASVASSAERALAGAGVKTVLRKAGRNAYGTAIELAKWSIAGEGMSADSMGVATAGSYYDALTGAALCGRKGGVLVLADAGYTDAIAQVVRPNAASIERGYVFGGTASVAPGVLDALAAATK